MAVLPPDPVFSLRCPDMGPVNSICFHQDQRLLAGTLKGNVFLWDLQTNRSSLNFDIGNEPITTLHHTTDMLISQEKGGTVTLWSMSNTGYIRQRTINGNYFGFCRTALYNNTNGVGDELLFYPCDENSIGVLHINDAEAPSQLLVPDDPQLPKIGTVYCIKPFECASQVFLLAGYESGHFLTWDLSSGVIVDMLQLEPEPMGLDYDPITNRGIVGGASDKLSSISYQRKSMQLQHGSDINIKNAGINCVRIRADQKVFATGGWDGRVRIFSWKSLRPLAVLTEHKTGGIMDIAYSEAKVPMWNAPIMAAAGMDGQITLWDLYN
ncbi:guanine nucleotide-binding protein subunit beta-like protein 1 [Teleopsis dalmanni]|uniref:guanine nucleotide-binding protein subunit beta-like protein 1 n=1 Tax=Teleopsis dalmanni TaxID=139649 RepID=UPI0018CE3905|nr:guanine nucleotide-binding protein subunit beta-like protein 1 [Teleopsis dalmanni]XP_037952631.1 guanine nucleotide-binding protein subunit beta-like protein 1 [Teleopsis dalmanni]XP_037952632.1 guanine nucleotide-binding protein subunit beta-like protein 1 [Teleopsis dalmanni]